MSDVKSREDEAFEALQFMLAKLAKYKIDYVITTGFACYLHGVPREISDIDIDIDISKDDPRFKALYEEFGDLITCELQNFVDANYDNCNFEATYANVILDICTIPDLKVFDPSVKAYTPFYKGEFPKHDVIEWRGLSLKVLDKQLVLENKEILTFQREKDHVDIRELKKIIQKSKTP